MDIDKYGSHHKMLVAVDCIIFGFDGRQLQALLIKRGFEPEKGKWSLMGGFVDENESLEESANRVLKKLTGLTNVYMEQLACFGDVHRDAAGRVVSVAYSALINISEYSEQLTHEYEAHWFKLKEVPPLIFDHNQMIDLAIRHLRDRIATHPIGFELLPEKFTLPQLQGLYEAIYGYPIDKRNFSRKILSLGILKKLNEKERTSRKGAYLYVFDENNYSQLDKEGFKII